MDQVELNRLAPLGRLIAPPFVVAAGEPACVRFLEFFAANIRNKHTRRTLRRRANFWPGASAPASRRSSTRSRCMSPPTSSSSAASEPYDRRRDEVGLDEVERILV